MNTKKILQFFFFLKDLSTSDWRNSFVLLKWRKREKIKKFNFLPDAKRKLFMTVFSVFSIFAWIKTLPCWYDKYVQIGLWATPRDGIFNLFVWSGNLFSTCLKYFLVKYLKLLEKLLNFKYFFSFLICHVWVKIKQIN